MNKRVKIAIAVGVTLIALAVQPATAKAEPDTVSDVAQHVCQILRAAPTVTTFNSIVQALFDVGNTLEQENEVMAYAMQIACPEQQSLARSAVDQATMCNCGPLVTATSAPKHLRYA